MTIQGLEHIFSFVQPNIFVLPYGTFYYENHQNNEINENIDK